MASRVRTAVIGAGSLVATGLVALTVINPSRLSLVASSAPGRSPAASLPSGKTLIYGKVLNAKHQPVRAEVLVYEQEGNHRVLIYRGVTHTNKDIYRLEFSNKHKLYVQFVLQEANHGKHLVSHLVPVKPGSHSVEVSGLEKSTGSFFVLPVGAY